MKNKIDYNFDWFDYQITLKCKCGNMFTIDDNEEEYNTAKCSNCGRKYHLSINTKIKEIKK